MSITPLTTTPNSITAPSTFNTDMDTHLSELPIMISEMNALAGGLDAVAAGTAQAIPYTFSTTTTDSDPGAGILRLSNATQASAVKIRADLLGSDATDYTDVIDGFDDSSSTITGQIRLIKASDPTKWLQFNVTAVDSSSGYRNITVVNVDSSGVDPFSDSDSLLLTFTRTGDAGAAGGAVIADAAGTVDVITADFSPDLTLSDKVICHVVSSGANTSTTPTFAPDGLTAKTIVMNGGLALAAGSIGPAGFVMILEYNSGNGEWELLNPVVASASPLYNLTHTSTISSPATAVDITSGFSSDYDDYYIRFTNLARNATGTSNGKAQLRIFTDSVIATTLYNYMRSGGSNATSHTQSAANDTHIELSNVGIRNNELRFNQCFLEMWITNANSDKIGIRIRWSQTGEDNSFATTMMIDCDHDDAGGGEVMTGFRLFNLSSTTDRWSQGKVAVYGMTKPT